MTIDEMIEKIKNDPNYIKNQEDITFGIKYSEEMENIRLIYKGISDAYILTHNILFKLIKELNKVSQELAVYNKAIELSCKEIDKLTDYCIAKEFNETSGGTCVNCKDCWKEYYLQKAREQNDDN